jgi:hypothetical protein
VPPSGGFGGILEASVDDDVMVERALGKTESRDLNDFVGDFVDAFVGEKLAAAKPGFMRTALNADMTILV